MLYGVLLQHAILVRLCNWRMAAALVPTQFCPSKSFSFSKWESGSKGEKRSFHAEWCQQFEWLHYEFDKDAAFCYLCMKCQLEKKFLSKYQTRSGIYLQRINILEGRHVCVVSSNVSNTDSNRGGQNSDTTTWNAHIYSI